MLFELKHNGNDYFCLLHYENFKCIHHCHKSFEIVFVEEGELVVEIQGKEFVVSAGQCATALPFQIHAYRMEKNNRISIAIFSADFVSDFYEQMKDKALIDPVAVFEPMELDRLNNPTDRYGVKAALYLRCSALMKNGIRTAQLQADVQLMTKIMTYIQEHYRDALTLSQMAEDLGYSYHYLSGYFKKHFGYYFSQYVNLFRLEEAARLLRSTELPLTEIAYAAGFSTIRNFNMVFKAHYGISPRAYRETAEK